MDQVQIRLDERVAVPPAHSGEGRVVSVNALCFWPSTATDDEIEATVTAACHNLMTSIRRKRQESAA